MVNREKYTNFAWGAELIIKIDLNPDVLVTKEEIADFKKMASKVGASVEYKDDALYFEHDDPGAIGIIPKLLSEFGW